MPADSGTKIPFQMVKDTDSPTEENPGFASQKELDEKMMDGFENGTFEIDANGNLIFNY